MFSQMFASACAAAAAAAAAHCLPAPIYNALVRHSNGGGWVKFLLVRGRSENGKTAYDFALCSMRPKMRDSNRF